MVRSCLLITLIKCLKGHKSLGSLCNVVKALIVSGNGPTDRPSKGQTRSPIELFWTAKKGKCGIFSLKEGWVGGEGYLITTTWCKT